MEVIIALLNNILANEEEKHIVRHSMIIIMMTNRVSVEMLCLKTALSYKYNFPRKNLMVSGNLQFTKCFNAVCSQTIV